MTEDIPPGAQCSFDGCENEAVDPDHPAGFCRQHHPMLESESDEAMETGKAMADEDPMADSESRPESVDGRKNREEEPDSPASNPTPESHKDDSTGVSESDATDSGVDSWAGADFTEVDAETWAPAQVDTDAWMCRKESKAPYAPWADADAPVECSHTDHDEPTTCAECDHHAGYKWGSDGSREHVHADHDTAREWASMDPTLSSDLVFIQRDADPFAFVDGDDVRDPETGEIHPAFEAILEHLGVTYADVSTSGSGVHAVYRGEIPLDGVPEAKFQIDTEPWGANEDEPAVEIYDGKHVCIATGDHVAGTGTEVVEWDDSALAEILRANGYEETAEPSADASPDLDGYEPKATTSDETTDDIRDIFRALDRLDPKRVGERTIVREWTRGRRSFLPTWGSRNDNGTANYINDKIWHDTGHAGGYGGPAVMAAIDAGLINHRGASPSDVSGETFFQAIDHLRDLGFSIPRLETPTKDEESTEDYTTDPRNLDVVLDAHRAWDAAGRVTPDDLDEDLALDTTPDGEDWAVDGVTVDVVRAVAVAVFDHDAHDSLDADAYDRAYRHAREAYGAPLPEYVTEADAADRYDVVLGAVRALDFFDLEAEALTADVADADETGDVTHYLDPSPVDGWRDSESGESVLVFESGTVYDADTEETIDALRLVALDAGLIDSPTDDLTGGRFQRAYRLARDEYGAPLPRWAIGSPDVEPVLPPAEDLVDIVPDTDDALQDARDDVEALYRQLARADGDVSVLRALPGLGKTTSAIKSAAEVPTSYLAPRKELQKDAAAKANDCGVSWEYLPVFGGGDICDVAVEGAVEAVREEGMGLLRNRRALLDAVDEDLYPDDDSEGADADDLDRATCSCAEGEHGDDWALAVHTARALDYRPGVIHTRAEELFGEPLPCQNEQQCEYSAGWDRIADGERPLDLVIGSYGHAHVESARTHYSLDSRGHTDRTERAVVLDEFVGDAFTEEFGDEFVDIAVWLASSLRDDVADRQDLFSADLWDDDWVRSWLRGAGAEGGQGELARDAALALADVADAVDTAADLLDAHTRFVDTHGLAEPLEDLRDSGAALDADEADRIAAALREPLGDLRDAGGGLNAMRSSADDLRHDTEDGPTGDIVTRVLDDVAKPLEEYDGADLLDTLPECVGGDLRDFAEDAVQAAHRAHGAAGGVLRSVATALEGGDAGCRELAIHADDGYAHRLAHRLLYGVVAPGGGEGVADLIETDAFDYSGDGFDGTRLKHVRVDAGTGTDTILVDRDHDGATVLSPPERTAGNGEECPVVGLDATARRRLWGLMLGADVAVEDIHDSMTERARFLRDGLGLQVVRTAQKRRFYEGDPTGKDLDGDVALIEEIDDEYAGVYAGGRNEDDATVGAPAVITTKGVRRVLEDDDRLDGKVAAWDNYGNITGDNDLGEHQLAAVLGCQHYGDAPVEKVAALAGEEVTRSGHGLQLSYDSAVANTYLKHMTEDQTMQAILRFTRGDTGAVVFARTAALREDLPVVGEGQVVRSWSDTAATVAREWKAHRGERFTVGDVADSVDVSRRQVRRVLDEFASAGYLEKHHTGDGVANEFSPGENPSAGEVELPSVAMDPDTSRKGPIYTGNVRVWPLEDRDRRRSRPSRSTLPAPDTVSDGDPPGTTAE